MPRKALQEDSEGVVKAQVLIRDGAVREVTILSGPRIFHASVKAAMLQYKCTADATEILATQEFVFKIE
jgi:protein TonB